MRVFGAAGPPELTVSGKVAEVGQGYIDLDRQLPFDSEWAGGPAGRVRGRQLRVWR